MGIDFKNPAYESEVETWEKIENVTTCKNVKQYLCDLNPHDGSAENRERNKAYKKRAVFYGLASQTLKGMTGSVFSKSPKINVPTGMEYVSDNVDGSGNSIQQQSRRVVSETAAKGRAGLVVRYPNTEGAVSQAEINAGLMVSTIERVEAEQITNWAWTSIGSKAILTLVVISEKIKVYNDDGYSFEQKDGFRELFLMDGVYQERVWIESDTEKGGYEVYEEFTPRKANGDTWSEIPFQFVGSENNDWHVDDAPMKGIVDLNIGHYRNSADYEDNIFYAGQAQPYVNSSDVSYDDIKKMQQDGVYLGPLRLMPFPIGYAQSEANSAVRQAMLDKVEQMVSLGARMMSQGSAAKTATQVDGELEIQHSVISLVAANVSEAYTKCLFWMAEYMGIEAPDDMAYQLNQDYKPVEMQAQLLQVVKDMYQLGMIPTPDYVRLMQRLSLFDPEKPILEYVEEIGLSANFVIE